MEPKLRPMPINIVLFGKNQLKKIKRGFKVK
jgi:hypothetical protein